MKFSLYTSLFIVFAVLFACKSEPVEQTKLSKAERIQGAIDEENLRTYDPALGYVPMDRMYSAIEQTRALQKEKAEQRSVAALSPRFNERGPNNIGGRTRSFHLDLTDPDRKKMWAGSVSGGLYVTEDITANPPLWKNADDYLDNLSVSSIVQDFDDPSIMYMGTGEGYGGGVGRGIGIFKSIDGGVTWDYLSSTSGSIFLATRSMAIQPETGYVYAALSTGGIHRSPNGGDSWAKVLGIGVPGGSPDNMYDVFSVNGKMFASSTSGVFMSETGDRGDWVNISTGSSGFPSNWSRTELAVCEIDEDIMFAVGARSGSSTDIYRTLNGGVTWSNLGTPGGQGDFTNGQAGYDLDIAIDPFDCTKAIVAGVPLWRTSNQGASWLLLPHSSYQSSLGHVDQHKVYFDTKQQGVVYFGNDGGIWRSTDGAAQFISDKNSGYITTQYYGCAFHPDTFSNYMLGGTQDNGTHRLNNVAVGEGTNVWGGDGFLCHIDQNDPNFQMVSSQYGRWGLSNNGGNSFSGGQQVNGGFLTPSDYDNETGILYTQTNDGDFYRWNVKTNFLELVNFDIQSNRILTIAVDPNSENRVYFGTSSGQVIRVDSANQGDLVEAEVLYSFNNRSVSSIELAHNDPDKLIVTMSNYGINNSVITSDDGGQTWDIAQGNLPDMPIRWAIFNPKDPSEALLATETGVWSTDLLNGSGTIWNPPVLEEGTPTVRTTMLQWRESDYAVLASTYGRGLWTSGVFSEPRAKMVAPQVHYLDSPLRFIGDLSINATSYEWDFGDGTGSTQVNPLKVYTELGEYDVSLTVNGTLTDNSHVKILPGVALPYTDEESYYGGSFEGHEEQYGTEVFNGSEFERGNSIMFGKEGTKTGDFAMVLVPDDQYYEKNTIASVYLPLFDFSEESIYTFGFWSKYWIQGSDGFLVQYSLNAGQTWSILGNQQSGWYTNVSGEGDAWPQNTPLFTLEVAAFTYKELDVSFLSGEPSVAFRFQFRSEGTGSHPGVAIDDVKITKYEGELQTKLTSFSGKFSDGDKEITLNWATLPEYYCQSFEIERSTNGRDFTVVDDVACNGVLSAKSHSYKFEDSQGGEIYFYRIKVISENTDRDYYNEFYSPTITVRRSSFEGVEVYEPDNQPKIFPNPFRDEINITFTDAVNQSVTFNLYDDIGRLVMSQTSVINDVFATVDVFDVAAGMYYLGITIGDGDENVYPVMSGF